MYNNPNKTVSANSRGIIISFRDANKHRFLAYDHVDKIQVYGKTQYQDLEMKILNKTQQRLYSEAVYGLNYFTDKQLQKMSTPERHRIIALYKKTQKLLNVWKQQIVNQAVDNFLLALFPKSPIVKQLASVPCTDEEYTDKHTFKELGITQKMIAEKLINCGILPNNFFQLA